MVAALDVADRTAAVTAALAQQLITLELCRPDG
jgi:hypothetical protein